MEKLGTVEPCPRDGGSVEFEAKEELNVGSVAFVILVATIESLVDTIVSLLRGKVVFPAAMTVPFVVEFCAVTELKAARIEMRDVTVNCIL